MRYIYREKTMEMEPQLTQKHETKSPVWNHFGLLKDESGQNINPDSLICPVCHVEIKAKSGNTSNLLSH